MPLVTGIVVWRVSRGVALWPNHLNRIAVIGACGGSLCVRVEPRYPGYASGFTPPPHPTFRMPSNAAMILARRCIWLRTTLLERKQASLRM